MANELPAISQNIKQLLSDMKVHAQKLGSTIGGHLSDVMSDEMKMVNDTLKSGFTFAKDTTIKTLAFFGKTFGLDWKTLKVQVKQLKILKWITGQMQRTEKSRLARFKGGKKGGIWGWLLWLLGIPLAWLTKGKLAMVGVLKWFKGLIPIKKILDSLKFRKITRFFEGLKGLFKSFEKLPGMKSLAKIGAGFRMLTKFFVWLETFFLGWDFMKGWQDSEGKTVGEKFRAGFTNQIEKLLDRTIVWFFDIFDVIFKTDTSKHIKKFTDKWSKIVVAFWDTALSPFTGIEGGLDSLLSELGITEKGTIDNAIKSIKDKITKLPGMLLLWFKKLPGVNLISDTYDYLHKKIFGEESESGGQLIRQKINDTQFDDLENITKRVYQDNWKRIDKAAEQRAGFLKALEINNEYQKKIFEKEAGEGGLVYNPSSAPQTIIPDSTGDKRIEDMTSAEIGYTF